MYGQSLPDQRALSVSLDNAFQVTLLMFASTPEADIR